jgi:hypothetical protein
VFCVVDSVSQYYPAWPYVYARIDVFNTTSSDIYNWSFNVTFSNPVTILEHSDLIESSETENITSTTMSNSSLSGYLRANIGFMYTSIAIAGDPGTVSCN